MRGFLAAVEARILVEREEVMASRAHVFPPPKPKGGRPPIPQARIDEAVRRRSEGATVDAIASEMRITRAQVKCALAEAVKARPSARVTKQERDARDAEVRAMTREGKSSTEIGRALGLYQRAVYLARKRAP